MNGYPHHPAPSPSCMHPHSHAPSPSHTLTITHPRHHAYTHPHHHAPSPSCMHSPAPSRTRTITHPHHHTPVPSCTHTIAHPRHYAGCRIPPLIGLCTKNSAQIGGKPIFLPLRDPMINSLFGDYTEVPPILVIYDKKDKPQLGKLYEEHILMKVMLTHTLNLTLTLTCIPCQPPPQVAAKRRKTMSPGEKLIVLVDGVGGHINQNAVEFKALEKALIEFFKGAANSTSVLQVADLIKMFHNIKVPDQYVNKLTQDHWNWVRKIMSDLIGDFIAPYFSSPVREAFIDTLTVLFHIIYPSMTQLEIQKKWHGIGGYGSFRSLMQKCKNPPTETEITHYENKLDSMKLHWVKHGKITDKEFADKFDIHGDKSVDAKAMKSQRVVHLTHPEVVADTLNDMQKKIEEKQAVAERAAAKERKKRENRFNLTGGARSDGVRRKQKTEAVCDKIRAASTRSVEQDDKHCMVKTCLVKWRVLKRYEQEYNVKMYKCVKCEQWMCNMCCKTDAAFEFHKLTCPGVVRKQAKRNRSSGRKRKPNSRNSVYAQE